MPWSEQLHDRTGRAQDCRLRRWFPKVELRKVGRSVTLYVYVMCVCIVYVHVSNMSTYIVYECVSTHVPMKST